MKDINKLAGEFDARVWAREWIEFIKEYPSVPNDFNSMHTWFANAIMAGYDYANAKNITELEAARALIAVLMTRPEWEYEEELLRNLCPFCLGIEPEDAEHIRSFPSELHIGHKPDCPRQLALAAWEKARGE